MVVAMAVERAAVRTAAALEGLVGTGCVERGTLARWRKRARSGRYPQMAEHAAPARNRQEAGHSPPRCLHLSPCRFLCLLFQCSTQEAQDTAHCSRGRPHYAPSSPDRHSSSLYHQARRRPRHGAPMGSRTLRIPPSSHCRLSTMDRPHPPAGTRRLGGVAGVGIEGCFLQLVQYTQSCTTCLNHCLPGRSQAVWMPTR